MITIKKFDLTEPTTVFLDVPVGSRILKAGFDPIDERLCFWCLVDEDVKMFRKITVSAILSGEPIDATALTYLDTVRVNTLVFHLFYFYN